MYQTSDLYNRLITQDDSWFEYAVVLGESGRLITRQGQRITFGGVGITISQGGGDSGFKDDVLISVETERSLFAGNNPEVGKCLSAEITVQMFRPSGEIPRMAVVKPYVRVTDGVDASEWIPQGVFYIDTRESTRNDDGLTILTLHAYDAMLMAERDYPNTDHEWPVTDTYVVQEIANAMGVQVDSRTWEIMTNGYQISTPAGYSMREVLGNIAAMYAGNFVMNYDGELLLVALNSVPGETNLLCDEYGFTLVFGEDRINV